MAKLLSRTQALRVVGQELDALGISVFELTSWGDDYVVWPKQRMLGPAGNTRLEMVCSEAAVDPVAAAITSIGVTRDCSRFRIRPAVPPFTAIRNGKASRPKIYTTSEYICI